jgi:phosphoserine phosphatase
VERTFPWRLVTVDIDGTLTRGHGWKEIARAFGRLEAFEATNARFFAHQIDEDSHLANLLNIAAGHTVSEVEEVLARTPKLAGVLEGIAELHERGARVALLTHNPDYVVDWYRRTFGFDDAEAVVAQPVEKGRIGPVRSVHADKPSELRALLARAHVPAAATAHVGDGRSDAEVFRLAGGGVALNSPYPEVAAAADLALVTTDFRDVVAGLSGLSPRP